MPQSIFQESLLRGFVQADFNPLNDDLLVLYQTGELICYSSSGKEKWRFKFPDIVPFVFRINAEGRLLAVLGDQRLCIYDMWDKKLQQQEVDPKTRLLEFYKNCIVLGGYQDSLEILKPNGNYLKSLLFKEYIHQFRVIPQLDALLIHNRKQHFFCSDFHAGISWKLNSFHVLNDILISDTGHIGYVTQYPDKLIQFNSTGDDFYEITDSVPHKLMALSKNGEYLLIWDVEKSLKLYKTKGDLIWKHPMDNQIVQISISKNGRLFFTIDTDNILTCYETLPDKKSFADFFELQKDIRVTEKSCAWSIKPGMHFSKNELGHLTTNNPGTAMALLGLNGDFYFYSETKEMYLKAALPGVVNKMGISDRLDFGYLYGEGQMILGDLRKKKSTRIIFDHVREKAPAVNYALKWIIFATPDKHLYIYDFSGNILQKQALTQVYHSAVSCEKYGFILFNDNQCAYIDDSKRFRFKLTLPVPVRDMVFYGHHVMCPAEDDTLIVMDLIQQRAKKQKFPPKNAPLKIVSCHPLMLIHGDHKMYILDDNLKISSTHEIQSPHALFFIDDGQCYEIHIKGRRCLGYNGRRKMVWRYVSDQPIHDAALTQNGLVLMCEDQLQYLTLKKEADAQQHFSDFLEL